MSKTKIRHLSEDEIIRLLEATEDTSLRLMILVGYYHGLRASEICGLTGANIEGGMLTVKRLKRSFQTEQPFIERDNPVLDEAEALRHLARTRGPKERLFEYDRFAFYYRFKVAAKKAGLPPSKRNPHVLKHSCAMVLIPQGIDAAREWLGHRSIASTGEYLRISQEQAARAAKQAFGR